MDTQSATATYNDPVENEWQALFVITERWQSDSAFFADEIRFLQSLIDKYFVWLIDGKNIDKTGNMVNALVRLERKRVTLDQNLRRHLEHLTNLIENPFSANTYVYHDEHANLELTMSLFLKDFRSVKRGIFKLTEEIIESEKSKHLLGR